MDPKVRPLSHTEEARLILGLGVQPFLAGGLGFVLYPVLLMYPDGRDVSDMYPSSVTDSAVAIGIGAALLAAALTFGIVWPIAVWLMKRRQLQLIDALWFGLVLGSLPYGIAIAAGGPQYRIAGQVRFVLFSTVLGLACATAFWAITLRPRRASSSSAPSR